MKLKIGCLYTYVYCNIYIIYLLYTYILLTYLAYRITNMYICYNRYIYKPPFPKSNMDAQNRPHTLTQMKGGSKMKEKKIYSYTYEGTGNTYSIIAYEGVLYISKNGTEILTMGFSELNKIAETKAKRREQTKKQTKKQTK